MIIHPINIMKPISDVINSNTKKINTANTLPQFSNLRPVSQGDEPNYRHIPKTNFDFTNPSLGLTQIHSSKKAGANSNFLTINQPESGL